MSEETSLSLPPQQIPIVIPPLRKEELLDHFNKIQELKRSLIDAKNDMITIVGKPYILKSGWRKLAFAFNLTDTIVREEKETTPDGETVWRMWVKVTAPNGREVIGVAAASSAEREFAHEEHDPYALCHTRAKNRAISDILGLGEVSAEEVMGKKPKPVAVDKPAQPQPVKPAQPKHVEESTLPPAYTPTSTPTFEYTTATADTTPKTSEARPPQPKGVMVRFLKDYDAQLVGDDGRLMGPFKAEDVACIRRNVVDALVKSDVVKEIRPDENLKPKPQKSESKLSGWIPLKGYRNNQEVDLGSINVKENGEAELVPAEPIPADLGCVKRPLMAVLDNIAQKNPDFSYYPNTEGGKLASIQMFGVTEKIINDIKSPAVWSLSKALEKTSL